MTVNYLKISKNKGSKDILPTTTCSNCKRGKKEEEKLTA